MPFKTLSIKISSEFHKRHLIIYQKINFVMLCDSALLSLLQGTYMGLLTNGAPDKVGGRLGEKMVKKDFICRAVNKQC